MPVEPLYPSLIEDGVHGHYRFELPGDFAKVAVVEHACGGCGFEAVGRDWVPAAEDQVIERGQWHNVANQRSRFAIVVRVAEATHLADGADRRLDSRSHRHDAGDEG